MVWSQDWDPVLSSDAKEGLGCPVPASSQEAEAGDPRFKLPEAVRLPEL